MLSHVPVRKPNRTEFVRVHPDPVMAFPTAVFVDKHTVYGPLVAGAEGATFLRVELSG